VGAWMWQAGGCGRSELGAVAAVQVCVCVCVCLGVCVGFKCVGITNILVQCFTFVLFVCIWLMSKFAFG